MTQSESIFNWLEENKDFFKAQAICKRVGIDKGNFSKYKTIKSIPEKYIEQIISIITPFGFKHKENFVGTQGITYTLKKTIQQEYKPATIQDVKNFDIYNQIDEIKSEKIPSERNTLLGRKIWAKEQDEKIKKLQSQIK